MQYTLISPLTNIARQNFINRNLNDSALTETSLCLYASFGFVETLNVDITASAAEIKQAYRREALKYHPDRNIGNETKAKLDFQEVNRSCPLQFLSLCPQSIL